MKLLSIYIAGFQSINRAAYVEFADGDISVIYGDNGCGKTTFLKLIHSILKRDDESLASENVMYVEIYYEKNNGEREFVPVRQIQEEVEEGIIKDSYDWSDLVDSELADCTSLSLGVERGVTSESLKVEPVDILRFLGHPEYRSLFAKTDIHLFSERMAMFLKRYQNNRRRNKKDDMDLDAKHVFLQNIKMSNIENMLVERYLLARNIATERIQNALFDTLAIAVDAKKTSEDIVMPSNFESDVYKNKERIIEALDDGFENNFKNHVVNILSSIQSESDVNKILENQLLRKLVMNMTRELKVEKQLLSSIN
ncbi:TPA: ATP-binding cassette domain-containing protein, partial [Escherichia coli]